MITSILVPVLLLRVAGLLDWQSTSNESHPPLLLGLNLNITNLGSSGKDGRHRRLPLRNAGAGAGRTWIRSGLGMHIPAHLSTANILAMNIDYQP
ncbi:hypothetical protein EYR41_011904 [Orbilia oligospora]|uniref:Secreted protein n=1 Tax=Orbilia oligospora TaxID=2813651 RepID=A0A8H2HKR8_ORBOL|nr:hypothetical protein EYR41_011904 [Orbilia oligospora]